MAPSVWSQWYRLSGLNGTVCRATVVAPSVLSLHQVLMVDPETPPEQIRKAYRKVLPLPGDSSLTQLYPRLDGVFLIPIRLTKSA